MLFRTLYKLIMVLVSATVFPFLIMIGVSKFVGVGVIGNLWKYIGTYGSSGIHVVTYTWEENSKKSRVWCATIEAKKSPLILTLLVSNDLRKTNFREKYSKHIRGWDMAKIQVCQQQSLKTVFWSYLDEYFCTIF